jgi:hypothetical protein
MPARFHIRRSFGLPSSDLYVFQGQILEGEIRPGMLLGLSWSTQVTMTEPIVGVEDIRAEEGGHTSLTVHADADARWLWDGLNVQDEIVTVTNPTA